LYRQYRDAPLAIANPVNQSGFFSQGSTHDTKLKPARHWDDAEKGSPAH
jgi:hypothetical protein